MKYWKEKENNPVENMQFWTGTYITKLAENEIFLYGSNPQGINGAGAAKAAMSLSKGAKHGVGRRFNGSNAYALVTKSLNAGFLEKSTGILYDKEGYCSVSPEQIRTNIDELYEIAKSPEHKDKKFLVSYQYEAWPNGTPKKSLNGYTSQEMLEMFAKDKEIPPNIIFHESYKPHLEKLFKKENKQYNGDLVVYENDKTIDIKEENIIWTIDSDERKRILLNNLATHCILNKLFETDAESFMLMCYRKIIKGDLGFILTTLDVQGSSVAAGLITQDGLLSIYVKPEYRRKGFGRQVLNKLIDDHHISLDKIYGSNGSDWSKGFYESLGVAFVKNGEFEITLEETQKISQGKVSVNEIKHQKIKMIRINSSNTQEQQQEIKPKEYTYFFHLTSPFSNFHPSKIEYKDLTFVSNEQFMMYSKAKTFKDEITAQKIIDMNNQPLIKDFIEGKYSREDIVKDKVLADQWNKLMMKVKGFGREVKNYDDNVWTNRRAKVVLFGAREKFTQNEDLKQIILNTGDTYMVESSPYDKIWGTGLSEYDCKRIPENKWPGLNLLGKVLNEFKKELKTTLVKRPKP